MREGLVRTRATGLQLRFHDLRHPSLTWAAAQGATIAELMHRAGHASPHAAMLYQHATKDRAHAVAEAMATLAKPASVVTFPVTGARPTE